MSEGSTLDLFVSLSSALTGYDIASMPLQMDVAQAYMDKVEKTSPDGLKKLLAAFQECAPPGADADAVHDAVAKQIMGSSDIELPALARRIIRLWYLSTWYTDEPPVYGPWPSVYPDGEVFGMESYIRGLAFKAAQAHPPGYSEGRYGDWTPAPRPDSGPPPLPSNGDGS